MYCFILISSVEEFVCHRLWWLLVGKKKCIYAWALYRLTGTHGSINDPLLSSDLEVIGSIATVVPHLMTAGPQLRASGIVTGSIWRLRSDTRQRKLLIHLGNGLWFGVNKMSQYATWRLYCDCVT